jgi:hypothetical protein
MLVLGRGGVGGVWVVLPVKKQESLGECHSRKKDKRRLCGDSVMIKRTAGSLIQCQKLVYRLHVSLLEDVNPPCG